MKKKEVTFRERVVALVWPGYETGFMLGGIEVKTIDTPEEAIATIDQLILRREAVVVMVPEEVTGAIDRKTAHLLETNPWFTIAPYPLMSDFARALTGAGRMRAGAGVGYHVRIDL